MNKSHYETFRETAQNHHQSAQKLKKALYNARKHEAIPWQMLADEAGIHRNTARAWYTEIEEQTQKDPPPDLRVINYNKLTPEEQKIIQKALE